MSPLAARRLKLLLDEGPAEIADGGETEPNHDRDNGVQGGDFIRLATELLDWPVETNDGVFETPSFQRDVLAEVVMSPPTLQKTLKVDQSAHFVATLLFAIEMCICNA